MLLSPRLHRDKDALRSVATKGLRRAHPLGCALLAVMVAGALFLAACGVGEVARGTVHGKVTDVQTRTVTEIESFSLRDEAGETWLFLAEGPLELTPSHLRQHMLSGEEVRVQFERRAAGLIAVSISDYP